MNMSKKRFTKKDILLFRLKLYKWENTKTMTKQISFLYLLASKSLRSFQTYGINGIPVRYTSWQYSISLKNAIFYRTDIAVHKIQEKICEMIYKKHPEIKYDLRKNVLLSAMIFGCFHAYFAYCDEDYETVIESLSKTSVLWASILH